MKKKLFLDMDGTVAMIYEDREGFMEKLFEDGFFRNLKPYKNMVEAIKLLVASGVEVTILSAYPRIEAVREKKEWVAEYLGNLPEIFLPEGENKGEYLENKLGEPLTKNDFLVDDYSKNLIEWENAGGTGIKFVNEINAIGTYGRNFSAKGRKVSYEDIPAIIAMDFLTIMGIPVPETISGMVKMEYEKAVCNFDGWIEGCPGWKKSDDGTWEYEIVPDYRDELSSKQIWDIFHDDYPWATFQDILSDMYQDEADYQYDELSNYLTDKLKENGLLNKFTEETLDDYMSNCVYVNMPYSYFLDKSVAADLFIDTGDGNYDYTLNSRLTDDDECDECLGKASLVWLAKTQGVEADELKAYLRGEKKGSEHETFLSSVANELANHPGHIAPLVFLVRCKLRDLLDYEEGDKITLRKNAMCGLYNPWDGGGSLLDIRLEKDVEIPYEAVYSFSRDGCVGAYSIAECYGMCSSAWRECLLSIK